MKSGIIKIILVLGVLFSSVCISKAQDSLYALSANEINDSLEVSFYSTYPANEYSSIVMKILDKDNKVISKVNAYKLKEKVSSQNKGRFLYEENTSSESVYHLIVPFKDKVSEKGPFTIKVFLSTRYNQSTDKLSISLD